MKIRKVLVAVDFSPPSRVAVNYGIALARKFNARLSLLHVVETSSALLYAFPGEAAKVDAQRMAQADRMLPTLVGPEDQDDLDVGFIVKAGEVEDEIESVVHQQQADIVVMGTHGRNLFGRLILGSVTQGLLRRLGVPVLTICHVGRPLDFKRVLFATDLGVDSYKGFLFALDFAATTRSALTVVHTLDTSDDRLRMKESFAGFESEAARRKVPLLTVIGEGSAAEFLTRYADENDIDFLILGLRKKNAMERALLGSTAEPLIRAAHVPVLSVPIDTPVTIVDDTLVAVDHTT